MPCRLLHPLHLSNIQRACMYDMFQPGDMAGHAADWLTKSTAGCKPGWHGWQLDTQWHTSVGKLRTILGGDDAAACNRHTQKICQSCKLHGHVCI